MTTTLTDLQRAGFQELVTIGVGRAAAQLAVMVDRPIVLEVPKLWLVEDPNTGLARDEVAVVEQGFSGQMEGTVALTFPVEAGHRLVALLLGEDEVLLPEAERSSALLEVGNVVINAVMGSLGNVTGLQLDFRIPHYQEGALQAIFGPVAGVLLAAEVHFTVDGQDIRGNLLLFLRAGTLRDLIRIIDRLAG